MKLQKQKIEKPCGFKFSYNYDDKEIASAYLYILYNDMHKRPFGIIEYVIVDANFRSQGLGTRLVKEMIEEARKENCYKLLLWSRYTKPQVHRLYEKLGFKDWGKEFRIDFKLKNIKYDNV